MATFIYESNDDSIEDEIARLDCVEFDAWTPKVKKAAAVVIGTILASDIGVFRIDEEIPEEAQSTRANDEDDAVFAILCIMFNYQEIEEIMKWLD